MSAYLSLIRYDATQLQEKRLAAPEETKAFFQESGVIWLHVQGEAPEEWLHKLSEIFCLHPLAVEDVLSEPQRPKAEEYEHNDFIVAHVLENRQQAFIFHKFCLFVGDKWLLSFHSGPEEVVESVRQRLRTSRGLIRQLGVDYLMYALLDTIIDGYFPALEDLGEHLDDIFEQALSGASHEIVPIIQQAKRQLRHLRRMLWPLRDVLAILMRDDNDSVTAPVRQYLRDAYDHVIQLMDMLEVYREMAADLMDAYLSALSHRMNSIMKVLTIIATLFMPLTFIVGVYGMNFRTDISPWNMPELTWRYGYVFVWLVMLGCVLGMLFYFRRQGWIGQPDLPLLAAEEAEAPAKHLAAPQRRRYILPARCVFPQKDDTER